MAVRPYKLVRRCNVLPNTGWFGVDAPDST